MGEGRIKLGGEPPVEVALRRSGRARRLSLRVSSLDGRVTLTLPRHAALAEARAFAEEKQGWIRRHLAERAPPRHAEVGGVVPFCGTGLPVRAGPVRGVCRADGAIWVPEARAGQAGPLIRGFLKAAARDALAEACDRHAAALGRGYGRLTLRDTRSRWGSCSAQGNLMFSWRLVMAPGEVLDYVAAHEVAHLAEMNHSPAYWAVVARLFPGHAGPRRWLRQNGAELHRVQFGARD